MASGVFVARKMRRNSTLVTWAVVAVAFLLWRQFGPGLPVELQRGDAAIAAAFAKRESGVMVEFTGRVQRLLEDDDDESPHQRFIMELDNGQTVLVAHNLKLASRVPLEEWDTLTIRGEYEWNEQGGVVHWTHRDPGMGIKHGWVELHGERYE
jgi:hypothetical protein